MDAIIKLGYACNNNCIFCHAKPKSGDSETKEIIRKMDLLDDSTKTVYFSGGEPTIRKDLLRLMKHARDKGFRTGLITNARMLSRKGCLDSMIKNRLTKVFTSFFSADEETHASITRTDSFQQTVHAIRNMVESGIDISVNVVLLRQNLPGLDKTIGFLHGLGVTDIRMSFVEPVGDMAHIPSMEEAASVAKGTMDKYPGTGWDCFPLCLMKGYEDRLKNMAYYNIGLISEVYDEGFCPADQGNKAKQEPCSNCRRKEECEGIYIAYMDGKKINVSPY